MTYPELTIKHNHGTLVLADALVEERAPYKDSATGKEYPQRFAVGTVVGGGRTSRLFHATSYKPFPVGERMEWPLYGRTIYPVHDKAGSYTVDCCFCG